MIIPAIFGLMLKKLACLNPNLHPRRVHWHTFRSGSRSAPERQRLELRWLLPIPVKVLGQAPGGDQA